MKSIIEMMAYGGEVQSGQLQFIFSLGGKKKSQIASELSDTCNRIR